MTVITAWESWKEGDARASIPRRIRWGHRQVKGTFNDGTRMDFQWAGMAREYDQNTRSWKILDTPRYILAEHSNMDMRDTFETLAGMKTFIIRWVYDIHPSLLIPSELLADAKLRYKDKEFWVDNFCTIGDAEIIEDCDVIYRPADRKIRLPVPQEHRVPAKTATPPTFPRRYIPPVRAGEERSVLASNDEVQAWLRHRAAMEQSRLQEVPWLSEISDDRCIYSLESEKCNCVWEAHLVVKLLRARLNERYMSPTIVRKERSEAYVTE